MEPGGRDDDAQADTLPATSPDAARTLPARDQAEAFDATLPAQPSNPSAMTSAQEGDVVPSTPASYELGAEVARGGMGVVRLAQDRRLDRTVALKELLDDEPQLRARFEREARVTGQLQHPSIVPVYDMGRWPDGRPFYAMKLVEGRPLDDVVEEALDADARLALIPRLIPAVEAIAFAHERRVIHRDLKPANILLGAFGETVVIDWGLAKSLDEADDPRSSPTPPTPSEPALTMVGAILGTPAYMAPEQARGEAVDERADVYALGALLYHALSGKPPYDGPSPRAIVASVMARPPRPLAERAPEAPADLVGIVDKAMARDPSDRYRDARRLARDLQAFSTGRLVAAYAYTSWELFLRFVRRNRAVSLATVLLIVISAGGTVALLRAYGESERERARAVAAEGEAVAAQRATHDRLAQVHWQDAARRLRQGDHLGAAILAAAALTEHPDNPQSPHAALGDAELADAERAHRLAGPGATLAAARALRWATYDGRRTGHEDWLYDILTSGDGRWLVTAAADKRILIYGIDETEPRQVLEGHEGTVFQLALDAAGEQLASSSYDGTVRLWSFPDGKLQRVLEHPSDRVYGLCYAQDDRVVAIGLGGRLAVFDAQTGDMIVDTTITDGLPWRLTCARDAPVAVLSESAGATLFDPTTGDQVARLVHGSTRVQGVALTPDAKAVITADVQGVVRRFDATDGEPLQTSLLGRGFSTLTLSDDGRWLALGSETITVLDADALRPRAELHGHRSGTVAMDFTPDGRRLITGSLDKTVVQWRIPESPPSVVMVSPTAAEIDSVTASPDRRRIASGGSDTNVRIWSTKTGRLERRLDTHKGPIRGLRFLDDQTVASSGMDRKLLIHDLGTGEVSHELELPHFGDEIALPPSRDAVAVGVGDGSVLFYDRANRTSERITEVHGGRCWWVGFDPTGARLASASFDGTIAIIDPKAKKVLRKFEGHEGRIYAAAWHPRGILTTADLQGWVRFWDPETGKEQRSFRVLAGERIYGLAWTDDGARLLVTTADGVRTFEQDGGLIGRLDIDAPTMAAGWLDADRLHYAARGQVVVMPLSAATWQSDPARMLTDAETAAGNTLAGLLGLGASQP